MIISDAHVVKEDHSDEAPAVDEDPNDAVSQDDDESSEEAGTPLPPSSSRGKRSRVASLSSLVTHLDTLSAAICRLDEIVQTSHTRLGRVTCSEASQAASLHHIHMAQKDCSEMLQELKTEQVCQGKQVDQLNALLTLQDAKLEAFMTEVQTL